MQPLAGAGALRVARPSSIGPRRRGVLFGEIPVPPSAVGPMRPLASTIILGPEGRPAVGVSYYGHQDEESEDLESGGGVGDVGGTGETGGGDSGGDSGGEAGTDTMAAGLGLVIAGRATDGSFVATDTFAPGETASIQVSIGGGFTATDTVGIKVFGPLGDLVGQANLTRQAFQGTFDPFNFVVPNDLGTYQIEAVGGGFVPGLPFIGGLFQERATGSFTVVAAPVGTTIPSAPGATPNRAPGAPLPRSPGPAAPAGLLGNLKDLAWPVAIIAGLVILGPALASRVKQ